MEEDLLKQINKDQDLIFEKAIKEKIGSNQLAYTLAFFKLEMVKRELIKTNKQL